MSHDASGYANTPYKQINLPPDTPSLFAIFLMRICGRLHFGRWAKVCPYWLMQIGVQPRSIASTADVSTSLTDGAYGTDYANRAVDIDPNDIESINILN